MQSEYWFDGDVEKKVVNKMNGNETYEIVSKVPTAQLDDGLHQFNFRVMQSDGMYSPVLTRTFFKMSGNMNLLEYWFDGDNSNVRYIYGKTTDGNTVFQEQIDLSDVPEGVHRLYYRGISVDGVSSTAISSTPIMVKPRNNFDPDQQKVVSYSVAVDDETAINYNIMEPAAEIFQHNIQKLSGLKEGNHKVTVKAWNTAGAGVSETKTFKVVKQEPPKLELTTTVDGGIVFLEMNTIPGGQDYEICKVVRRYSRSPKEYFPIYKKQLPYPKPNIYYDVPDEAGSYTYIGRCWYYDSNREKIFIESKEMDAYVEIANKNREKYGYVLGTFAVPSPSGGWVDITDEDGNSFEGGYALFDAESGTFKSPVFPVGKQLTFSINENFSERYKYVPTTVTVKAGRNDVTIEGERIDGVQPNNYEIDLFFDSGVTYEPYEYYKFKVKNESIQPWKGYVRVRVVNKSLQAKLSGNDLTHGWYNLWGTKDNQQICPTHVDTWAAGESKEVMIPLDGLVINETDDYFIYFETVASGSIEPKRIGLNTRKEMNLVSNPYVRKLEKNSEGYVATELAAELADLALSTMVLRSDYFDERLGNLREFGEQVMKGIKNAQKEVEYDEEEKQWMDKLDKELNRDIYPYEALITMVDEHYSGEKPHEELKGLSRVISNELRKNPETLHLINEMRTEMSLKLQDMLGAWYHVGAGAYKAYAVWSDIKDYYNKITNLFGEITEYNRMDSHTKFFYKTRIFIKAADKALGFITPQFAPFARVLQTYMDIAEQTVIYALDNDTYKYQFEEAWLLQNNHQDTDDYFWTYKNKLNVNFRVQIQAPWISDWTSSIEHMAFFDFTKEEAQRQVMEVNIILANNKDEEDKYDVIPCQPQWDSSGFYLMTGEYYSRGGIKNIGDPLTKFLMQIRWRNGRTSLIPLKESKGVTFSTVGGPCYTVTFESDACNAEFMADVIYLVGDRDDIKK